MTLLETLVAVAVAALVATVAFPVVGRGIASVSRHEETAALVANLRFAHAQAIRLGAPVAFSVARDGRSYGWSGSAERPMRESLALAPGNATVAFYPDGSSSGGEIDVVAPNGRLAVRIDAVTGAVVAGP